MERAPLVDAAEERLALAQDDRVDDQPKLIDQVFVQKACDEGCPTDDVRVPPRLALEGSLPVVRVHVSSQNESVDVKDQLDRVAPRLDPVLLSVWSFG